ncbi:hypothetical protein ID866_3603 [Astraeus odoratus]|nr:hypothetical protein ID866_3603 [Astraeus odoratus]
MRKSHPAMSKLRLKRTPAEEAERAHRKAHNAARKAAKKRIRAAADGYTSTESGDAGESASRKKRKQGIRDDGSYGPPPPPPPASSHEPDTDAIFAEMEEAAFIDKMWGALEDDERLDAIDSRFRSYVHIPDRWRDRHAGYDDHVARDPQYMDDNEYAEWVREGMWRRKHAREYEERARKQTEKAARRALRAEIRAETARLERAAAEQREQRRQEKMKLREEECRQRYEIRWKGLLEPWNEDAQPLTFADIPWPLFPLSLSAMDGHATDVAIEIGDFTEEAISRFLVPSNTTLEASRSDSDEQKWKERKDKLKEAMLRFHPDKFEGRIMRRVSHTDRDRVKEAVGQVARVLNTLMRTASK